MTAAQVRVSIRRASMLREEVVREWGSQPEQLSLTLVTRGSGERELALKTTCRKASISW